MLKTPRNRAQLLPAVGAIPLLYTKFSVWFGPMCHRLLRAEWEPGERRRELGFNGSTGSEAEESSPGAGRCEGCPADPAHLHGPRLPLQEWREVDQAKYRNPYDLHVSVYYLLGFFLCELSFCFPKELHGTFSSLPLLGADNTKLSKICAKQCPV